MGGVVAFEMAMQLSAAGREVPLVFLSIARRLFRGGPLMPLMSLKAWWRLLPTWPARRGSRP